jgi:hypothetical protein
VFGALGDGFGRRLQIRSITASIDAAFGLDGMAAFGYEQARVRLSSASEGSATCGGIYAAAFF